MQGDSMLGELTAFVSPPRALVNAIIQTTGELDFGDIFNSGNLLYSPAAYLLFLTFVVILPIIFNNLLVSKSTILIIIVNIIILSCSVYTPEQKL